MPILTVPKSYRNNAVLRESDLDNVRNALLSFFNVTRLDSTNLQLNTILSSLTESQVDSFLASVTTANVNTFLGNASVTAAESLIEKSNIVDDSGQERATGVNVSSTSPTAIESATGLEGTFIIAGAVLFTDLPAGTVEIKFTKNDVDLDDTPEGFSSIANLATNLVSTVTLELADTLKLIATRSSGSGTAVCNAVIDYIRVR